MMNKLFLLTALTFSLQAVDFKASEYNRGNNFSNNIGQCTWYVDGRVQQKLGIKLKFKQQYGRHAQNWPDLLSYKLSPIPKSNSIAIWKHRKYGHVAFVEDVHHEHIHFTEANVPANHRVDKYDGVTKKASIHRFEQRFRNTKFLGYLHLEEI